jgi:hypothetical protein
MLADRAAVLDRLVDRLLGVPQLLLFVLLVMALQLGWGIVGAGLVDLNGQFDPLSVIFLGAFGVIGLAVLVPLAVAVGFGVRRDRRIRRLIGQWAALDLDPARDTRHRAPGLSVLWFLVSFLIGAFGLWISFAAPSAARPGSWTYGQVAYFMGMGTIFWVMGLIGTTKAVGHYRWAVRLLAPVPPAQTPGGAHR